MSATCLPNLRRSLSIALLATSLGLTDGCARVEGHSMDDGTTSVGEGQTNPITGDPTGNGVVGPNPNTYTALPDSITAAHDQATLAYMANWPAIPGCANCTSYEVRDWKESSAAYHKLLFDENATGTYLPLSKVNAAAGRVGMPSYVNQAIDANNGGEALTVLGGLVGASLTGSDMRNYKGRNWVAFAKSYAATPNATPYVVNNPGSTDTLSAWYVLFPTILEAHLASSYRADPNLGLTDLLLSSATTWASSLNVLVDNWDHSGFDFRPATFGVTDIGSKQPDMGIGIAYISELAYEASGKTREDLNLAAARSLASMDARATNPSYQVLGFYGPLVAARRNALRGEKHALDHYFNWVFAANTNPPVRNWAMLSTRWGSYDVYGLYGGIGDGSSSLGTAYSLYSLTAASALAPVARYAPAYAKAIGRYLLHVAVNAQLFFPDAVSSVRQDAYDAYQLLQAPIAYENLSGRVGAEPYAAGGAARPTINQAPYGAWAQGFMAALVAPTDADNVLQIDLLATDPWHPTAYPTYLYYNPNGSAVTVEVAVPGSGAVDFVDTVSGTTLARQVSKKGSLTLAPDQAVVLVMPTSGQAVSRVGNTTLIGGVAVDWGLGG